MAQKRTRKRITNMPVQTRKAGVISVLLGAALAIVVGGTTLTAAALTGGFKNWDLGFGLPGMPGITEICRHENLTELEGKAATCTATGLTIGKVCEDCGTVIEKQEIIPMHFGNEKPIAPVNPTCTTVGLSGGKVCGICGAVTEEPRVIYPISTAHEYVEGACRFCGELEFSKIRAEFTTTEYTIFSSAGADEAKQYLSVQVQAEDGRVRDLTVSEYDVRGDFSITNAAGFGTVIITQRTTGLTCSVPIKITEPRVEQITAQFTPPDDLIITEGFNVNNLREYIECTVLTSDGKEKAESAYVLRIIDSPGIEPGLNTVEISCYGYTTTITVYAVAQEEPPAEHTHNFELDICTECGELYYTQLTAELINPELELYSTTDILDLPEYITVTALDIAGLSRDLTESEYTISGNLQNYNAGGYSTVIITQITTGLTCAVDVHIYDAPRIIRIEAEYAGLSSAAVTTIHSVEVLRDYITCNCFFSDGSQRPVQDYELSVLTPSGGFELGENTIAVTFLGERDTFTINVSL